MIQTENIILASGSPRRKELLTQAGLNFVIVTADVDETPTEKEPVRIVEELSRRKALAVAERLRTEKENREKERKKVSEAEGKDFLLKGRQSSMDASWILAADTIVAMDGDILGKPSDEEDAVRMLRELSGKTHEVYTGVTLLSAKQSSVTFSVRTGVKFYPLSETEILDYVASGEPMDKAGAYGIQGLGARLVERIEGDYNNVVGLPLAEVQRRLNEMGVISYQG